MTKNKICKYCKEGFKTEKPKTHFLCPTDGLIHQDKVNFLCNTCGQSELVFKDGIYFCPKCFTEAQSYKCQICGSTKVSISGKE